MCEYQRTDEEIIQDIKYKYNNRLRVGKIWCAKQEIAITKNINKYNKYLEIKNLSYSKHKKFIDKIKYLKECCENNKKYISNLEMIVNSENPMDFYNFRDEFEKEKKKESEKRCICCGRKLRRKPKSKTL